MSSRRRISIALIASSAVAMVAGPVASASADTHYAAPFRLGKPFGVAPCTDAAKACSLPVALGQATSGDSVQLAEGDFWKTSIFVIGGGGPEAYDDALLVPDNVTLHGTDPADLPVIHVAPNAQAEAGVELGTGSKIRDVAIDGKAKNNNPISYSLSLGRNSLADRVRVRTFGAPGATQIACTLRTGSTLRSSLCLGSGSESDGKVTAVSASGPSASFSLRNVTAITTAKESVGLGFGASGDAIDGGAVSTIAVSNSILRGTDVDFAVRAGSDALRVTANVDHSNWASQDVRVFPSAQPGASSTLVSLGGNQNGPTSATPLFVDAAAGDFRMQPGSPTIDVGVIDPVNNGSLGLGGQPRVIGLTTDIGAHEFDPASIPTPTPVPTPEPASTSADPTPTPAPASQPTPAPGTGPGPGTTQSMTIDRTPPVLSKLSLGKTVTRKKGAALTFTLSEPATVVLAFGQPAAGRTVGTRCVKQSAKNREAKRCTIANVKGSLTVAGRAGVNALPFKGIISAKKRLALGRYTLTATPTDAAGNRGTAPTRKLTLTR